jgi:hypothetical protein
MRAVDVFGILAAIMITLLSPFFTLWSWSWWAAISIAGILTAVTGVHILWNNLPAPAKARLGPAICLPAGKCGRG